MSVIDKDFIKFEHLNSEYITEQATAICKELEKDSFDTEYVREKLRNIESFLASVDEAWGGVRGELYAQKTWGDK